MGLKRCKNCGAAEFLVIWESHKPWRRVWECEKCNTVYEEHVKRVSE
jgi:uncharacterized Zn finger protein